MTAIRPPSLKGLTSRVGMTPLWVISLFLALTEVVVVTAVIQTSGSIQIALTGFVIGFPLLVFSAFFTVLWYRPYVFYPPSEFGAGVGVAEYVGAMGSPVVRAKGLAEARSTLEGAQLKADGQATAGIGGERVLRDDAISHYSQKIFEDFQGEGEQAWIFMHTVPLEESFGLVNMLQPIRINRKGYDTHLVLSGPGSLLASATGGFPNVGDEELPGGLTFRKTLQTFMDEGGHVYVDSLAAAMIYGIRDVDMMKGVKPMSPLDVLDATIQAQREGTLVLNI